MSKRFYITFDNRYYFRFTLPGSSQDVWMWTRDYDFATLFPDKETAVNVAKAFVYTEGGNYTLKVESEKLLKKPELKEIDFEELSASFGSSKDIPSEELGKSILPKSPLNIPMPSEATEPEGDTWWPGSRARKSSD